MGAAWAQLMYLRLRGGGRLDTKKVRVMQIAPSRLHQTIGHGPSLRDVLIKELSLLRCKLCPLLIQHFFQQPVLGCIGHQPVQQPVLELQSLHGIITKNYGKQEPSRAKQMRASKGSDLDYVGAGQGRAGQ